MGKSARVGQECPTHSKETLMSVRVEFVDRPSAEVEEAVNAELREHNLSNNAKLWAALDRPEHAAWPLNVIAFDGDDRVVGGLFGETRFAWLKIAILSVR